MSELSKVVRWPAEIYKVPDNESKVVRWPADQYAGQCCGIEPGCPAFFPRHYLKHFGSCIIDKVSFVDAVASL